MSGYDTAAGDIAADHARILALWRTGLAHGGMPEAKLDWYYRANPEGTPSVIFLRAAGVEEPVGVASIGARRMQRGSESLTAGTLGDFVVVPEHRNFFPALALQKAVLRHGLATHTLVFGMPNPRSEAIVGRAGYRRIGEIVRRARVVRSSAYFSRHMPRWLGAIVGPLVDRASLAAIAVRAGQDRAFAHEWVDRPDARFDEFWGRAAPAHAMVGARDARFLAWRFSDCPLASTRFFVLMSGPGRRLAAYAACQVSDATLCVRDFLSDPAIPAAGRYLWRALAREAWRAGVASVSVEFLGDPAVQRQIEASGWVVRARRGFYAAVGDRGELPDEARWYVTQADEDG